MCLIYDGWNDARREGSGGVADLGFGHVVDGHCVFGDHISHLFDFLF